METAIVSVKPVGCKRPNVNVVIPSKLTDRRVNCTVNVVLTPRVRVHESPGIGTKAGELFPEGLEVVPEEMAETASTGDLADNQPQQLCTKTTVMNLTTDYVESKRPAPRRVLVEVTEEARCEPVSWMIEGDLGQSVESLCEGTARVPTVRFDVGQLMQWPDINYAGVMICGFMLESEMPSLGSVRRTAEPVSVVTKS